jgi:2Fe-2S ferredoxin
MSKLIIRNLANIEIEIPQKATSVLHAIQEASIDWMHACGGKGRCTTCRIKVLEGMQHISHPSAAELKYRNMDKLNLNERLTCQCQIFGDVVAEVPPACQLPHMKYEVS